MSLTKKQLLVGGLGLLLVLNFLALPFLGNKGASFTIVNEYDQPVEATCEVNPDSSFGLPMESCSTNPSGYAICETPTYPNILIDWVCWCRTASSIERGTVQIWDLGVRNVDVTLDGCPAHSGATTLPTTTLAGCVANGGIAVTEGDCCTGCGMYVTPNQYLCESCSVDTSQATTSRATTTRATTQPTGVTTTTTLVGHYCGDGVCDSDEGCLSCDLDCGSCSTWDVELLMLAGGVIIFLGLVAKKKKLI